MAGAGQEKGQAMSITDAELHDIYAKEFMKLFDPPYEVNYGVVALAAMREVERRASTHPSNGEIREDRVAGAIQAALSQVGIDRSQMTDDERLHVARVAIQSVSAQSPAPSNGVVTITDERVEACSRVYEPIFWKVVDAHPGITSDQLKTMFLDKARAALQAALSPEQKT